MMSVFVLAFIAFSHFFRKDMGHLHENVDDECLADVPRKGASCVFDERIKGADNDILDPNA